MLAEARECIAQAVEENGLEIAEYREIGYLLENDDELRRLDAVAATGPRASPCSPAWQPAPVDGTLNK